MGVRIAVLANQASGACADLKDVEKDLRGAFTDTGAEPTIACVPGDQLGSTGATFAQDHDVVVAAGGDGTVAAIASALVEQATSGERDTATLGVLPLGTFNHFAKDAGIPLRLADAAQAIVHGRTLRVDVALANDRLFLNNLSIGVYPHAVEERDRIRATTGASKPAAMLLAARTVLRRAHPHRLRLTVNGEPLVRRTPLLLVGNNVYHHEGIRLGRRDRLDAGCLSLHVARASDGRRLWTLAAKAALGRIDEDADVDVRTATTLTIEARPAVLKAGLDGEVVDLRLPIKCSILPQALAVRVPEADP